MQMCEDSGNELRRTLSLPMIVFYGLGTILGAGIYVLVGKVAGLAGMHAPIAFLLAGAVAALTAFAYAELSSRYPLSGGEAVYVQRGLGRRWLSMLVGSLVALSGLVSSATLANGFVGYLRVFLDLPDAFAIAALVCLLGALAAWGIMQSVLVASIATLIEVAGLLVIVAVCWEAFAQLPGRLDELLPPPQAGAWQAIVLGAFLAFYAFVGFEDMVNVAEEVKQPERNMPRAIVLVLVVSSLLYFAVATAAVLALPLQELAASSAPLALVFERMTGAHPALISLVSLFAVVNGALIQMIMAARMLYGMSREGWLPRWVSHVSPRTRTPLAATGIVTGSVLLFALALPLVTLAKATTYILLCVFVLINLALIRIKRRFAAGPGVRVYPAWVPKLGIISALILLAVQTLELTGVLG